MTLHQNKDLPPCYAIIPARYQSSRFPGKPLALILGRPMFWHVYKRCQSCQELKGIYLATDDLRIQEAAKKYQVPVLMTANTHVSGTDRILEAARALGVPDEAVILNVQGDEPALDPKMLSQLIQPFADPGVQVATLARRITKDEALNPNQVKVIFDEHGQAIYFSRSPIPYARETGKEHFFGHIGLYAFRLPVLETFSNLSASPLEQIEKLEQLRLIEARIPIQVILTKGRSHGVDRPEDIKLVENILKSRRLAAD